MAGFKLKALWMGKETHHGIFTGLIYPYMLALWK